MKECVIFGAAPATGSLQWIRPLLPAECTVICADGGFRLAERLGMKTDFLIGDMDSLGNQDVRGVKVLKVPVEKDETDLFLCVEKALELGYQKLYVFGALGGRMDHTFGNLALLYYGLQNQAEIMLFDEKNMLQMTNRSIWLEKRGYRYFSVFAYGGDAVYSVEEARYPCHYLHLNPGSAIGSSNEMIGDAVEIQVHSGTILLIASSD